MRPEKSMQLRRVVWGKEKKAVEIARNMQTNVSSTLRETRKEQHNANGNIDEAGG